MIYGSPKLISNLFSYRKKIGLYLELSTFTAFLLVLKMPNQLTMPSVFLLVLVALFFFVYLKHRKDTSLKSITPDKGVLFLTVVFGVYLLLSLSWTCNFNYGLIKAISLFLIFFPLTVLFSNLLMSHYDESIKYFGTLLIMISAGLTVLVIASEPFKFNNTKNMFGFTHVGFGRIVSLGVITVLFKVLSLDKYKVHIYLTAVLLIVGLLVSGLRGAVIATTLTVIIIILNAVYLKKMRTVHSIIIITSLAAAFSIFLFLKDYSDPILQRYKNLETIQQAADGIDGSINARKKGLFIAGEMILSKPIFGLGLGGYKQNFDGQDISLAIEYPHNILAEVTAELGVIGLLIFLLLIFKSGKKLYYNDFRLFAIWMLSLLLGFFSGNISDQKIFFILIGVTVFLPVSTSENKMGVL